MDCSKIHHESSFLRRSKTLAMTASHIGNIAIIKPTYVVAKSSLDLVKSFWSEGVTIANPNPTIPQIIAGGFIYWYYPTLKESATKCGDWTILSNALSTFISSFNNSCLSKESWAESWKCVTAPYYIQSSSGFFTKHFIDPFLDGNCKLFQADLLTVLPAAILLTLPLGYKGLKKVIRVFKSNIHDAYHTPPLEKTPPFTDKLLLPSTSPISPELLETIIKKELERLKNEVTETNLSIHNQLIEEKS